MILEVDGISKAFGGLQAIDDVSFGIKKGEIGSVIGPNGAGKSTLFNLITGHITPDTGKVMFKGKDITNLSPHEISRLGVGRSFQRVNIFNKLTTFQNIQLSLLTGEDRHKNIYERAQGMLSKQTWDIIETVGLTDLADSESGLLSYGDQKRLEIGIALGGSPEVLLLDEPTAGMSPEDTKDFTRFISEIAEREGLTILFVEHDMEVVFSISEYIRVLHQGAIIAEGTPQEIKDNQEVQQVYMGGVELDDKTLPGESTNISVRSKENADNLLRVEKIDTFYDASHILFDVSLEIREGEVVSLLGRNGVGKTTTLRSIMGLTPPRKGKIILQGKEITGKRPYEVSRAGIGLVPEDRVIFPDLTVRQNLEIAKKGSDAPDAWRIEKLFEIFPVLDTRQSQLGGTLSGGEQQMLTIARTLMGNPQLLLLDEPSEGLAPRIVKNLFEQLKLLKSQGLSILLSEQNSHFALMLSDRVYVLEKGRVCWQGLPGELLASPDVMKQYLGI